MHLTGHGFNYKRVWQHFFIEIDQEIFSTFILSLLQSQGQLSVSGERICTSTGQLLRGLSMPRKNVVSKLNGLT